MIKIAVVGKIGSGKTFVANAFQFPVFNADKEVANIYKKNRDCFQGLKKKLPKFIKSFPINKEEISNAILENEINLKRIVKIIHPIVRKKMKIFLKKNKNKKVIVLDIPLYFENKLNLKKDVVLYISAKNDEIQKRLKKRPKFNQKLINRFKKIQLKSSLKKKRAQYIINNNFKSKVIKKKIKTLKKEILKNEY